MSKINEKPIIKRIAIKAECSFASPALIGSGLNENTDSDILRDKNDNAFLPGSTVAGVLRNAISDAHILFGKGNISPIWVFDAELTDSNNQPAEVIELDGVELGKVNKTAVAQKKYDFEAIETGSKFTLRLLLTIRDMSDDNDSKDQVKDNDNDLEIKVKESKDSLMELVSVLKSGYIAFGAKTRRGFGKVECNSVVKREFDLAKGNANAVDALNAWLDFEWDKGTWDDADSGTFSVKTEAIIAKLKLMGSIMIRDTRNIYDDLTAKGEAPDYKHMSSNGKPVIFGTSWAGAFRSGLYRLLESAYPGKAEKYLDSVFGYVYEKKEDANDSNASNDNFNADHPATSDSKTNADHSANYGSNSNTHDPADNEDELDISDGVESSKPSEILFDSSFLKKTNEHVNGYRSVTRVKIDRFTGGAADSALFTEMPWYGGETTLKIRYPNDREDIRDLILLGLDGLNKGIIQVGGEGSVGRGFFKVIEVSGTEIPIDGPKLNLKTALENFKIGGVQE